MKTILTAAFILMGSCLFAQQTTWSPDVIEAKQENLFTGLSFEGISNDKYLVYEIDGGVMSLNRKFKKYLHYVNTNDLKREKEVPVGMEISKLPGKGEDYYTLRRIELNNRTVFLFINLKAGKEGYPVYFVVYDSNGNLLEEGQSDISLRETEKSKLLSKHYRAYEAARAMVVNYSKTRSRIYSAYVKGVPSEGKGVISIAEWDENFRNISTADHQVPLEDLGYKFEFNAAMVYDIKKDPHGFYYLLVQTGNPNDKNDVNIFDVYQFKDGDPAYFKAFKNEWVGDTRVAEVKLFQENDGNVYVGVVSLTEDRKKKVAEQNRELVNTYFIGRFMPDGSLKKIAAKRMSKEEMAPYDLAKTLKKNDFIFLSIGNILETSEGGAYVLFQELWTEIKFGEKSSTYYYHYGNMMAQYYNVSGQPEWEKTVHMHQVLHQHGDMAYAGVKSLVVRDSLFLFFPDSRKNANIAPDDPKVEKFSVIKLANKDLVGFTAVAISPSGEVKRKYIHWPEDKTGFALNVWSIYPLPSEGLFSYTVCLGGKGN